METTGLLYSQQKDTPSMADIPFFQLSNTIRIDQEAFDHINLHYKDKKYSTEVVKYFTSTFGYPSFRLTKSCTQALELAAILADVQPGDEVIMPSYAFVSIGNAFALRGAKLVFVDIKPGTMNIDESLVEPAITQRTKAVVTINYSGVACEYDVIQDICKRNNLFLVEDNAHGLFSKYKGQWLGRFGDVSMMSFDFLKVISCGEGGTMALNNLEYENRLRYLFEMGTNRYDFFEGKVNKYEWQTLGSNLHLSEYLAAMLHAQLAQVETLARCFKDGWDMYVQRLEDLKQQGKIDLPEIPEHCEYNGYNFYIKTSGPEERKRLIDHLKQQGIESQFHYVPLHVSAFGQQVGRFHGEDVHTTRESQRLLRLPLHVATGEPEISRVCEAIAAFY